MKILARALNGCGRWAMVGLALGMGCSQPEAIPTRAWDDPLPPLPAGQGSSGDGAPGGAPEYVLAFADEFGGTSLDATKWFSFEGDPHHKDTINSASRALASVSGGSALISAAASPVGAAFPFAAGYVDTHGLFAQTYGKIEFRARCAYAPGVWYALWGRAWADLVPEIDVEFLAENVTQVWLVNHWGVPPLPADQRRGVTTVNGADITAFHTYTIVWKPDLVEWQIDGKAYRRVTDEKVPHEAMFWVMNAWVGGWGGTPSPATRFPAVMEVDYLRIYRLGAWLVAPAIRIASQGASFALGDTIDVEIADFGEGAHVDVWEGTTRLATLPRPPFHFPARRLSRAAHALTFTASDGTRTASTTLDVTVHD